MIQGQEGRGVGKGTPATMRLAACAMVALAGCGKTSSLLLQRQSLGPLSEERAVAAKTLWQLNPSAPQTQTQAGVDVTITYAAPTFLQGFFSNKELFGPYAGLNPYFSEQLVFYVKIANRSGKKIRITPAEFVVVDDRGSQFSVLNTDYTTALAEAKAPISSATHGALEEAHPGYFGIGVPLGKLFPKSQRRFALLSLASLQSGILHDGVVHDGLLAFWSPNREAQHLKLILPNIKTNFDSNDEPQTSLDFIFEFSVSPPSS